MQDKIRTPQEVFEVMLPLQILINEMGILLIERKSAFMKSLNVIIDPARYTKHQKEMTNVRSEIEQTHKVLMQLWSVQMMVFQGKQDLSQEWADILISKLPSDERNDNMQELFLKMKDSQIALQLCQKSNPLRKIVRAEHGIKPVLEHYESLNERFEPDSPSERCVSENPTDPSTTSDKTSDDEAVAVRKVKRVLKRRKSCEKRPQAPIGSPNQPRIRKKPSKKTKRVYDRENVSKWPEVLLYLLREEITTEGLSAINFRIKTDCDDIPSSEYDSHSAKEIDSDIGDLSH